MSRAALAGDADDPAAVTACLQILADKTGALIATAARYGAMFGGCDEATVRTPTAFGEKLGVVFQLADDLLDIDSPAHTSGKTPGHRPARGQGPGLLTWGGIWCKVRGGS